MSKFFCSIAHYFPIKLFSDLYPTKLYPSAKLFFPRKNYENRVGILRRNSKNVKGMLGIALRNLGTRKLRKVRILSLHTRWHKFFKVQNYVNILSKYCRHFPCRRVMDDTIINIASNPPDPIINYHKSHNRINCKIRLPWYYTRTRGPRQ